MNLTQEALAKQLEVTNQAVSKWESDICCPDIMLLPKMADIFGISLDELFGRKAKASEQADLPWEDDGALRAVLYVGRTRMAGHEACGKICFQYEGPALNVHSDFSVSCEEVQGSVTAGTSVNCDEVQGSVMAGTSVQCDCIAGNVSAGNDVICDAVGGSVRAGGNVTCDCVDGDVNAGGDIHCDEVCGSVIAAGGVYCDHMEE